MIKQFLTCLFCLETFLSFSQYCPINANTVEPITSVVFSNINNVTAATGTPGYQDFSAIIGNVAAGSSYTLTVKGNTVGNVTSYFRAYFDWNNNGDFLGSNEVYDLGSITNSNGTDSKSVALSITIPSCDISTTVRMRIIKTYLAYTNGPCTPVSYGQIEDYSLNVSNTGTITPYTVTGGNPNMPNAPVGLSGSQVGVTYQLQKNGISVGSPIAGTGSALNFGNQGAGVYTVLAYTTGNSSCPKTMSGNVVVAVEIFDYTGADQNYNVPSCATKIRVHLWGAAGGGGDAIKQYTTLGGGGGYATGEIAVTPNENLSIVVGAGGTFPASLNPYGGGGTGGGSLLNGNGSTYTGNGGGRSAIKRAATELATAGGGGGGGETSGSGDRGGYGGAGGGLTAVDGYHTATTTGNRGGKAGNQSAGGAAGTSGASGVGAPVAGTAFKGGNGGYQSGGTNRREGGGGGSGFYGGGGGAADNNQGGGGGGGSSYIGNMTNAYTTSNAVTNGESAEQNHEYNKGMFGRGGQTNASGNNGRVVIEIIEVNIQAPTIGTVTQPTCSQAASVILTGLPSSGNWTLTQNPDLTTISGSGTSYTISGLNTNTTYSWSVTNANGCTSENSADVLINSLPTLNPPTITTNNSTCSTAGSSSISNYVAGNTYTFSPSGPNVAVNGDISNMTVGTSYTVTTAQGSCTSTASASFSNSAQLTTPVTPTISVVSATCNADGSASISNYVSGNTYTFSPAGPTLDNNGNISAFTTGTSYTVISSNGSCSSTPSSSFTIDAQTPAPTAPTVSSPQSFCGSATVSNLSPSTSDYKWYTTANGGTPLTSSDALITGTYYVSQMIGNCESQRVAVNVIINSNPTLTITPNTTICSGDSIVLTTSGANNYVWQPSNATSSSITVSPSSTTTYTVTGTTTEGCSNTSSVTITVLSKPIASFSSSVDSGYVSLDVTFTNTSSNATNYSWTINNSAAGSSSIFTHTFDNEGSYTVTLTASNGTCSDVATKTILAKILPPPVIIIPNIFTPNGDGANDEFFVEAQGAKDLSLEIFNRWGNMIHTLKGLTNGISDKWDGKGFSDGTYFYKYKLTDLKDNTSEGNGFFHLAR